MNAKTKSNPTETCESIKLGIDAHAKWYYVGRQVDGTTSAAPDLLCCRSRKQCILLRTGRRGSVGYQFVAYPHPQVIITSCDGFSGDPVYSETVSTLDFEEAPKE